MGMTRIPSGLRTRHRSVEVHDSRKLRPSLRNHMSGGLNIGIKDLIFNTHQRTITADCFEVGQFIDFPEMEGDRSYTSEEGKRPPNHRLKRTAALQKYRRSRS